MAEPRRIVRAPVAVVQGSEALWAPLRNAWLAWRVATTRDLHVNGGHAIDAERYAPVLLMDSGSGRPTLAFERASRMAAQPEVPADLSASEPAKR